MSLNGRYIGRTAGWVIAVFFLIWGISGCNQQGAPGGGSTPDVMPPAVSIITPSDGCAVNGSVTVTADASDDRGVVLLELYKGEDLLASFAEAPYEYLWDTTEETEESECCIRAVAYDSAGNFAETGEISVRIDNEQVWNSVGTPDFTENYKEGETFAASSLRFIVDGSAGVPYAAFITDQKNTLPAEARLRGFVMRFINSSWETLGGESFAPGIGEELNSGTPFDFCVLDGVPYVAYADPSADGALAVKKYDGTNWVYLGESAAFSGTCQLISLCIRQENGRHIPWVFQVYGADIKRGRVSVFDDGRWSHLKQQLPETDNASLYFFDDDVPAEPHIIWHDLSGSIKLSKFDGSNWIQENELTGKDPEICVSGDTLYLVYTDDSTGASERYAAEWNGSSWSYIGCSQGDGPIFDSVCAPGEGTAGISVCGSAVYVQFEEAADTDGAPGTSRFLKYEGEWQELDPLPGPKKMTGETRLTAVNGFLYRAYISPEGYVNVEKWY